MSGLATGANAMADEILDTQRVATASIRGYYFQFLATVEQWIGLGPNESLLCEGNEDIDRWMGESVEHHSLKHLAGSLTENSDSVKETIGNFAREFVFQRRRGKNATFVFRTTATLGAPQNHPILTPWLEGEDVDSLVIRQRLLRCAEGARREETRVALRYLGMFRLLRDFFAAVKWKWGELDYRAVRGELTKRINLDARFVGLEPNDVADKLIAQVVRVSSSERNALDQRRLTAFQLDQIAAELSLKKHVVEFRASRGAPSRTLYASWENRVGTAALVVGRFASEDDTKGILSTLRRHRNNEPGAVQRQMLFESPVDKDVLGAVGGLDVDFYAAFGQGMATEHCDGTDWSKLAELLEIATSKFDAERLVVSAALDGDALARICSNAGLKFAVCDLADDCSALTRWVAQALAAHSEERKPGEWRRLSPWAYHKMRYIENVDTREIFTQRNPLD